MPSDKWRSEKGKIKGNSEEARRPNNSIEVWEHRAREINDKFIQKGKIISADAIKKDMFAKTEWRCGSNAASKHIQRIRKFVTKCVKRQWLEKDPFAEYEFTWEETHRTFLTDVELKNLMAKKIGLAVCSDETTK